MSLTGVPPVQMPKNMGKMPMRLMGETPMLRRVAFFNGLLGFDFRLPYDEWLILLKRLGYSVEIAEAPHQKEFQGKPCFHAEIVARKKSRVPIKIDLTFGYKEGNNTTPGTLYSIYVLVDF